MNIGLLMTYNEVDVIEESLQANSPYVDAIFALDGSSDGTFEILSNHPKVELVLRDQDVTDTKVRDWHRQYLLDAARTRYGYDHWYTLLHGDEIFHDNPREIIVKAEKERASFVNWAAMQFFFHLDDEKRDLNMASVQDRLHWYSPFWIEIRQFRDQKRVHYRTGEHGRVVPRGVGFKPFSKMPIFKHYPYRSPQQMAKKQNSPGFSASYREKEIFRSTFQPIYKTARYFKGGFEEFELDKQKHLIFSWLRWLQLVKHW